MRQLFDGVVYMHDRSIVHRDLKLENILCIDDERIVISDFGFATHLEKGTTLRGRISKRFIELFLQSFVEHLATSLPKHYVVRCLTKLRVTIIV